MIYLDTSCLLKLLREEPESAHVRRAADAEDEVLVSSLTELETEVQLKAAAVGGGIRRGWWRCGISTRFIFVICQRRFSRPHCGNTGIHRQPIAVRWTGFTSLRWRN